MIARFAATTAVAITAALLIVLVTGQQSSEAVYPGTNGKIAFVEFTGNNFEIWTMNPDGSGRTQVTNSADDTNAQPVFSPDGEWIGFLKSTVLNTPGLYRIRPNGTGEQHIPNTEVGDIDLTWAPGGDKIAFERLSGPSDIFSINLDGTNLTNLTNTGTLGEGSPDWSPLGDKIAYASGDIWVMNADGSNRVNVTNTPGVIEDSPDWSPDGSQIIFESLQTLGPAAEIFDSNIAIVNADGTGYNVIVDDPNYQHYPAFSPDGSMIAYGEDTGVVDFGISSIIVANADGTNPANISSGGNLNDVRPEWGVDEPSTPATATPTPAPSPSPTPTPPPGGTLIWGDDNCSGSADPVDSLLTLRSDAGLPTNTGECPEMGADVDVAGLSEHPWGDVDCSGFIDPVDSLKLLRFDAGLGVTQTTNCPLIGSEVQLAVGQAGMWAGVMPHKSGLPK